MALLLSKSYYLKQKELENNFFGTAYTFPATTYAALFVCNFNASSSTPGYWAPSIAATAGQYVAPTTANGHLYVCTTAGTTGTTQPTWPTGIGSTVTDGTAVWTEATEYIIGFNTTYPPVEVSGGGYARQAIAQGTTDWQALSNSSDKVGVQTANNILLTWASSVSATWGLCAIASLMDASTVGDFLYVGLMTSYVTVISGNPAPTTPVGNLVIETV